MKKIYNYKFCVILIICITLNMFLIILKRSYHLRRIRRIIKEIIISIWIAYSIDHIESSEFITNDFLIVCTGTLYLFCEDYVLGNNKEEPNQSSAVNSTKKRNNIGKAILYLIKIIIAVFFIIWVITIFLKFGIAIPKCIRNMLIFKDISDWGKDISNWGLVYILFPLFFAICFILSAACKRLKNEHIKKAECIRKLVRDLSEVIIIPFLIGYNYSFSSILISIILIVFGYWYEDD